MADKSTVERLKATALEMRKNLLRLMYESGSLHIGGCFSETEIMTGLWFYKMKYDPKNPKAPFRDRFILSKGHTGGCQYVAQAMAGYYTMDEVCKEMNKVGGRFSTHPCDLILNTVEVSTGSLGHGLPIAVGMAITAKRNNEDHRVFVIMGDGESQEGSVWEAAMAGHHYELGNLVVFTDRNRISNDGFTEDYMRLDPLGDKWRAFGWNVIEIDGNDMEQVVDALDSLPPVDSNVPTMIIANTTKGKGVSFMENTYKWHAGAINDELYHDALAELEENYKKGGIYNA